jgi:hypothetical protein
MLGEAIKKRLDRRPFEPFRLHITGADAVEVRHPELAFLTRYSVVVGHGAHEGVADYVLEYSLIHIVKIEPANGRQRSGRNGAGRSRRSRGK